MRVGATDVVDPADLMELVSRVTGGRGADLACEFTGVQAGLDQAFRTVRESGKLVVGGFHQGGLRTLDLGRLNWMAIDLINAHFRDEELILGGMGRAVELLNRRVIDPGPLVGATFPLEQTADAFAAAASGVGKVVVTP